MIIEGAQGPRRFAQERTRAEIDRPAGVRAPAASGRPHIIIPEMIDIPGKPFRVMQSEVTVGLFKQLRAAGYEITGHNAEKLRARLGGLPEDGLGYLSLCDGRALAQALRFRVPTEAEWVVAQVFVGDKLLGSNWELTETKKEGSGGLLYILRRQHSVSRFSFHPEGRMSLHSVRLIEDKQ